MNISMKMRRVQVKISPVPSPNDLVSWIKSQSKNDQKWRNCVVNKVGYRSIRRGFWVLLAKILVTDGHTYGRTQPHIEKLNRVQKWYQMKENALSKCNIFRRHFLHCVTSPTTHSLLRHHMTLSDIICKLYSVYWSITFERRSKNIEIEIRAKSLLIKFDQSSQTLYTSDRNAFFSLCHSIMKSFLLYCNCQYSLYRVTVPYLKRFFDT